MDGVRDGNKDMTERRRMVICNKGVGEYGYEVGDWE